MNEKVVVHFVDDLASARALVNLALSGKEFGAKATRFELSHVSGYRRINI